MSFLLHCQWKTVLTFLCFVSLCVDSQFTSSVPWFRQRNTHQAQLVNNRQLQLLAGLSNMQQFDQILNPILIPRVVGSKNHAQVKQYLKDSMKQLGWDVESDISTANTPVGPKTFENIIGTLNPQAPRRLVLACHFDSKPSPGDTFIGATDSAVPCAMMINLARDMSSLLNQQKSTVSDLTLQLIFFDGEEAFVSWSATDSIYGSRNLAAKWASKPFPENSREGTNHLNRIDLMVLLDLLGTKNPTFLNYVPSGERWFKQMANIEARLKQYNLISNSRSYFSFDFSFGGIEDDHIPFMQRGVPILHLIPSPFPSVWHTDADNKSALDYSTIDNLNKILRVFVAEYLNLSLPTA